jgi:radical SAM superfamily enzyme YgiQ (UPF0313 family)
MKILLLVPPTDLEKSYGKLKEFSNPQPAIGVAYIASVLKKSGYDVVVIDAYVNMYRAAEVIDIIGKESPDVIGISVLTPSAEVVYTISEDIRTHFPDVKIVMGNIHASIFSDEILAKNYADVVVHREGEITMLQLVGTMEHGGEYDGVNGISFRRGHQIVNTPVRANIAALDNLPFPAWELLPLEDYSSDPRTEVKRGSVEMQILASRGCPGKCTFCSSRTERSLGGKYRMRNAQAVVDEMFYMHKRFGSRVFSFVDLAFPLVRRHAVDLCNEIIKRNGQEIFNWFTECRVKPLDVELLALMKRAGCMRVCYGIESGNDEILRRLKKGFNTEDVRSAVRTAHDVGLDVDGMFMIGLPSETEDTIKETIEFAVETNVRYAIFNIFVPYPGCELYDKLKAEGKVSFKHWSDFTSYPTYSGGTPVYVPDEMTHEQIMSLQEYAMRRFYLRPRFIIEEMKRFKPKKIRSYWRGFKGLVKTR